MCGISAVLYKNSRIEGPAPVGADLVKMLEALAHRGRDSTGITVVGEDGRDDLILRIWTENEEGAKDILARAEDVARDAGCTVKSSSARGQFLRLTVDYDGDVAPLAERLIATEGVELHSIGRASEVVKDVGTATAMDSKHAVGEMHGTHGIGHVRMATESRVDISHSHPFWAYPFPDVTVVHNGQLTNYHKLKRHYEDAGHRFQTQNDSELIAVYLADKMAGGEDHGQRPPPLPGRPGWHIHLSRFYSGRHRLRQRPVVGEARWSPWRQRTPSPSLRRRWRLRSVFSEEIQRVEPQQSEVLSWSL